MMATQVSILDDLVPDLVRYLSITNLAPHLIKARLLTVDEHERLEVGPSNTTRSAVLSLLKILKRKGPGVEAVFLKVLKASMEYDAHLGHATIIEALEKSLDAAGTAAIATPVPPSTGTERVIDGEDLVSSDGMYRGDLQPKYGQSSSPQSMDLQRESDIRDLSHRLRQSFPSQDPMDSRAPLKLGDIEYMDDVKRNKKDFDALKCKIVRDNSNIMMSFAKHVLGVYRVLSRLKVSISEIRIGLRFLGCLRNAPAEGNIPLYSASSDIIKAEKLEDLFECLHNYSSWYNYGLIKFVALEFGKAEGKSLIDDYEDELRKHFENLIAYQCPQFTLNGGIPPGYDTLIVKIDNNFSTYSAQDMALFQGTISSLLNLDPKVLLLTSIQEGCVQLTFAFPSAIAGYIVNEAIAAKPALRENGITNIMAAGKTIPIGKPEHILRVPASVAQPLEPPAHRSLAGSDSNTSHISFVSDLSSTYTKTNSSSGSSSSSNRSSTIIDSAPLNDTEAEILSIYSGTHSDHNRSSLESSHVGSPLEQTLTAEEDKPTFSTGQFFSECDLLANNEATPVHPGSTLRALSMPNCEMVGKDELCTGDTSCKKRRFRRARRALLSPLKLLPKFMRPSKTDLTRPKIDSILEEEEDIATPKATSIKDRFDILSLAEEPRSLKAGNFHYYKTDTSKSHDTAAVDIDRDLSTFSANDNRSKTVIPTVVVLPNSQECDSELSIASTISGDTGYYSNLDILKPSDITSTGSARLLPRRQFSLHSETTSGYNSPSGSFGSSTCMYQFGVPSSPTIIGQSMSPFICETVLYEEDEEFDDAKLDQGIGSELYKPRHSRKSSLVSRRYRLPMSDYGSNGRVESPEGSLVSSQCTSGYYSQQSLGTRMGSQDSFDDRERYHPPSRSNSLPKRDHCSTRVNQNKLTSPKSRSNSFH